MRGYWWVNQTDQHILERRKEIVAGRKSESTHWSRTNVSKMEIGDLIICYRSGIGIDRLAFVNKKIGICPAREVWDHAEDEGEAYVAGVEYFFIKKDNIVRKENFSSKMKKFAGMPRGPILRNGNIRYGYAMKFEENGFDDIQNIVKNSQPELECWLQKIGFLQNKKE